MYSAYTELLTASSAQSRLIQLILKFGEGVIARSIPSEHMAHMRCYRLIYNLGSMSLVANSFVTKRDFSSDFAPLWMTRFVLTKCTCRSDFSSSQSFTARASFRFLVSLSTFSQRILATLFFSVYLIISLNTFRCFAPLADSAIKNVLAIAKPFLSAYSFKSFSC